MNIHDYVARFNNHPVLFLGTGFSLRYIQNSYTWNDLLQKIAVELKGNDEYFLNIKSNYLENGKYKYEKIANELEEEFNNQLKNDRGGNFKEINDLFFDNMREGKNLSRFKIYISQLLRQTEIKQEKLDEIMAIKKVRKNIGSIITTNYDKLIEEIFEFNPLIGNDILLSNPYGSLYKIHGCVNQPDKIIITDSDYKNFDEKYELIRAQLLSLFIHNPIIFIGYNIGDDNIKKILKTIFTYVEPNTEQANRIRSNFLLVEFDEGSDNSEVTEHDIDMEGFSTIRINKIKTDNFLSIYNALSVLQLPVSAMDIRKVQNIVKEIYAGGNIKVSITENLEELNNGDRVLVIGSTKTIKYTYQTSGDMITNYFNIIDESNFQILELVDQIRIQSTQFFPIYGFSQINSSIRAAENLKLQQKNKLESLLSNISHNCKCNHNSVEDILSDINISASSKINAILYSVIASQIELDEIEYYLRNYENKKQTDFRRLLCAYDFMRYKSNDEKIIISEEG